MTYNVFGGTLSLYTTTTAVEYVTYNCNLGESRGCVKCKLVLHGLAAYLLNGLQQCTTKQIQIKMHAVNTHIMQNNKMKHICNLPSAPQVQY